MRRGQFAVLGAVLGAMVVGVFVIAYNSDVTALSGGHAIRQHAILILMLIGAGVGLAVFFFVASPSVVEARREHSDS